MTREELLEKLSNNETISNVDTSEIKDMSDLFNIMQSKHFVDDNFNQPLSDWDVSNVTEMTRMFCCTINFNQPLNNWDVSSVTSMQMMFDQALSFNQPLNEWDVSNVTNMERMFQFARSFNKPLNNWDVSNVENMVRMFYGVRKYTYSMKNWNLKSCCKTDKFLEKCNLWHLLNSEEDLPMQKGKRIDIGDRKTWKIL